MIQKTEPIFIIGSPRSGTTLLRLILTSHSQLLIPPESGFAIWYYNKYKNWTKGDNKQTRLNNFMDDLFNARKFETWNLNKDVLKRDIIIEQPATYSELIAIIYIHYGKKFKKEFLYWGDKNNFYLNYIIDIKNLFPKVKFIHIVRDGRNVACSYKKLNENKINSKYAPSLPHEIKHIAHEWADNISKIRKSFKDIKFENVLEIRFEDLILNPEDELKIICDHINIEFESGMLEYYKLDEQRGGEPKDFLLWKNKTKQPLLKNEIHRYLSELSDDERRSFTSIAEQQLKVYSFL